jgi:hypothetical protein
LELSNEDVAQIEERILASGETVPNSDPESPVVEQMKVVEAIEAEFLDEVTEQQAVVQSLEMQVVEEQRLQKAQKLQQYESEVIKSIQKGISFKDSNTRKRLMRLGDSLGLTLAERRAIESKLSRSHQVIAPSQHQQKLEQTTLPSVETENTSHSNSSEMRVVEEQRLQKAQKLQQYEEEVVKSIQAGIFLRDSNTRKRLMRLGDSLGLTLVERKAIESKLSRSHQTINPSQPQQKPEKTTPSSVKAESKSRSNSSSASDLTSDSRVPPASPIAQSLHSSASNVRSQSRLLFLGICGLLGISGLLGFLFWLPTGNQAVAPSPSPRSTASSSPTVLKVASLVQLEADSLPLPPLTLLSAPGSVAMSSPTASPTPVGTLSKDTVLEVLSRSGTELQGQWIQFRVCSNPDAEGILAGQRGWIRQSEILAWVKPIASVTPVQQGACAKP